MKKIYSFLASVLALASTTTAEAVTVIVDNPEAVRFIKMDYSTYPSAEIPVVDKVQDVNVFDHSDGVYIYPNDGYKLSSVKNGDTELLSSKNFYISPYSIDADAVLVVATKNLEQSRTASFTFTIDDPTKVRMSCNSDEVTISEGTQTIKFDPEDETEFGISSKTNIPIYAVYHNGKKVEPYYNSYRIVVANGDKVEIQANYPDVDYLVKVEVPEGLEDVFTGVTESGVALEGDFFKGVSVHAGRQIMFGFDSQKYSLDAMYVNGERTNFTGNYMCVVASDILVKVEAHAYSVYTIEVDVDDTERVAVYNGYSSYGQKYDLKAGKNTLEFTESQYGNNIYICATTGNLLKNIHVVSNGVESDYNTAQSFKVLPGDKFTIKSAVKEPDSKLVVWVDPKVAKEYNGVKFFDSMSYTDFGSISPLAEGVNTFNYCSADILFLNVSMIFPENAGGDSTPHIPYMVYNDGEAANSSSMTFTFIPSYVDYGGTLFTGDDILRIFYEQPVKATVAVTLSEAVEASKISVEVDTRAVADWASMSLFKGSTVKIIPATVADGKTMKCKVDGTPVNADADGNFSFTVTGDHNVALDMSTTGIDAVGSDADASAKVVYNLQGIRMPDADNLPAGIYIINGKKVAVK